jgi:hypothetical protein
VNVTEISDQLDAALGAILAAQAVLKKASGPLAITRSDILRKVDDRPRASADEPHARLLDMLDMLDDAAKRLDRLEAAKDLAAQHTTRKTAVL